MGSLEEAREIFSHDRYASVLSGAEVDAIGEDYAKCSMKITEDHQNAYGGVMGGAIYTLADFAFAVASNYDKDYATVSVVGSASFMSASNVYSGNIVTLGRSMLCNASQWLKHLAERVSAALTSKDVIFIW